MAYSNGTATTEQDLVGYLDTFLTSTIGGWTKVGTITDTGTDKDLVFKSSGETPGRYRDIYIRVRGYNNYLYFYGYSYWESAVTNDGQLYSASYSNMPVGSSSIDYWLFGDKDHFWVVAKNGSDLYSGGGGYLNSYYDPADNDLPLVIVGHGSISYAFASTTRVQGYSATTSGTNIALRAASDIHSGILAFGDPSFRDGSQAHMPAIMYCTTAGHQEIQGELKGTLMFSGVTLANEDWVTISGTDYKFFITRYSDTSCTGYGPVAV